MKSKNEEQKRKRKVTQKRTFIRGNEKRIKIKKKREGNQVYNKTNWKNLKTKLGKTKSKKKNVKTWKRTCIRGNKKRIKIKKKRRKRIGKR